MKREIDFNCDLGEGFGAYKMGEAAQMMPWITSANIACGFHAGDPVIMEQTVKLAMAHHVSIGAHPGYPDLQGFGRRSMKLGQSEVKSMLIYQIGALKAICEVNKVRLNHVKPHGALYNDAAADPELARWIAEAVAALDPDLIMVGLAQSAMAEAAAKVGLCFASEIFADRRYQRDGSLCPRGLAGAVLSDPELCLIQVKEMVLERRITPIDGPAIPVEADTLCLHGDSPAAIETAKTIHSALTEAGMSLQPLTCTRQHEG